MCRKVDDNYIKQRELQSEDIHVFLYVELGHKGRREIIWEEEGANGR